MVQGYFLKDADEEELARAIRAREAGFGREKP
jgi:DNA-binding NarL/FixJ family response regulator